MKAWASYCKQNGRRAIRFPRDVQTRKNSTYKLLARSFEYRDLLVTFIPYHVSHINLYRSHWDVCSNVCGLLKVFYTATNNLSGVYYPETNLFIIESLNIAGAFAHCESISQVYESVTAMKEKWLEYYKEFPNIYLIALCFDPCCRLESLPDYLSVYYEQGLKIDYVVDMCCARVKTLLYDLYDEYLIVYGSSLNIDVPQNEGGRRSADKLILKLTPSERFTTKSAYPLVRKASRTSSFWKEITSETKEERKVAIPPVPVSSVFEQTSETKEGRRMFLQRRSSLKHSHLIPHLNPLHQKPSFLHTFLRGMALSLHAVVDDSRISRSKTPPPSSTSSFNVLHASSHEPSSLYPGYLDGEKGSGSRGGVRGGCDSVGDEAQEAEVWAIPFSEFCVVESS
ncbi:hypothetical protein Dsin_016277 [Dipteronia sinensis]|uniref:Uncharacterized protein n=1 Tax=Dipteronia sinensis TaxID=43782 RepID=A0AAE0ACT3_9ROSI|nr:hypothetical protein Dsin_016277 [Dipteronia sinensis]